MIENDFMPTNAADHNNLFQTSRTGSTGYMRHTNRWLTVSAIQNLISDIPFIARTFGKHALAYEAMPSDNVIVFLIAEPDISSQLLHGILSRSLPHCTMHRGGK